MDRDWTRGLSEAARLGREAGYCQPPMLVGYSMGSKRPPGKKQPPSLRTVRLEATRACNLRCFHCRNRFGDGSDAEMPYDRFVDLLSAAAGIGVRSVILAGEGEPTLHTRFGDLIDAIHSLNIVPVVVSNCLNMRPKLSRFLFQRGASIVCKLGSLREDVQDRMSGVVGSHAKMRAGMENLLAAGFGHSNDSSHLRLGASFVLCRMNRDEAGVIWRFLRSNGVFPEIKLLTVHVPKDPVVLGQVLSSAEIQDSLSRLLDQDRREYGYSWLPHALPVSPSHPSPVCAAHVTVQGYVRPCAFLELEKHAYLGEKSGYPNNVHHRSLGEILADPLMRHANLRCE